MPLLGLAVVLLLCWDALGSTRAVFPGHAGWGRPVSMRIAMRTGIGTTPACQHHDIHGVLYCFCRHGDLSSDERDAGKAARTEPGKLSSTISVWLLTAAWSRARWLLSATTTCWCVGYAVDGRSAVHFRRHLGYWHPPAHRGFVQEDGPASSAHDRVTLCAPGRVLRLGAMDCNLTDMGDISLQPSLLRLVYILP